MEGGRGGRSVGSSERKVAPGKRRTLPPLPGAAARAPAALAQRPRLLVREREVEVDARGERVERAAVEGAEPLHGGLRESLRLERRKAEQAGVRRAEASGGRGARRRGRRGAAARRACSKLFLSMNSRRVRRAAYTSTSGRGDFAGDEAAAAASAGPSVFISTSIPCGTTSPSGARKKHARTRRTSAGVIREEEKNRHSRRDEEAHRRDSIQQLRLQRSPVVKSGLRERQT